MGTDFARAEGEAKGKRTVGRLNTKCWHREPIRVFERHGQVRP